MKKEEKHQSISGSIASDEPKISSSMLTLRQLNKEAEKKEAAAEAVKVRCRVCFKEIAPTRRCFGHGGCGGSGGSSDNASEDNAVSNASDAKLSIQPEKLASTEEWLVDTNSTSYNELESLLDERSFDPTAIEELIANGLLLINNDRELMTLSIKLQCEPDLLTEEQRHELKKFMEAIIKEFNEFKKENNLSNDCIKIIQDEKENILSLRITMPTLALYDAFIQKLANNLTSSPSPKIPAEDEAKKDQSFAPNPFSMELKPSSSSHKKFEEDENEQEIFNPSPLKPR